MFIFILVLSFSFMIEFIKSKQDDVITKELIKNRQLDQSMLRFTRIYQTDKDTFQRDDGSTQFSCVMSEGKKIYYMESNLIYCFSLKLMETLVLNTWVPNMDQ